MMLKCKSCRTEIRTGAKFCPSCGLPVEEVVVEKGPGGTGTSAEVNASGLDAENKAVSMLAYLGILVLVPLFAAKNDAFARYHANQGLVLAIAECACAQVISILCALLLVVSWRVAVIVGAALSVVWLGFLALSVLGLINAAAGKKKTLPVIGGITILK